MKRDRTYYGKSSIRKAAEALQKHDDLQNDLKLMVSKATHVDIVKEITNPIIVGDSVEKYTDINSHDLRSWKSTYYCDNCNKTPVFTKEMLAEGDDITEKLEQQYYIYLAGYFENTECVNDKS